MPAQSVSAKEEKIKKSAIIFALCFSLGLISYYLVCPNLDSDILWSIAIGKWISFNKTFPVVDYFSWTIYGKEWITHEWLFSFLAFWLQQITGNWGYYLLALVPTTISVYYLYLICAKCDLYETYAFIIPLAIGTVILYKLLLPFRAYVYGLMFFTILIYILYSKRRSRFDWLYLVILFCLWANFHSTVCLGVMILTVEMIRRIIIEKNPVPGTLVIITSSLASLLNPYGYEIWSYFVFALSGMGESKSIAEWQAANFNESQIMFVFLFVAATVILFQFFNMRREALSKSTINTNSTDKLIDGNSSLLKKTILYIQEIIEKTTPVTCISILFWAFYIYSLTSIRMVFYTLILWTIMVAIYVGRIETLNFTRKTYYLFSGLFLGWFIMNLSLAGFAAPDLTVFDPKTSPVEEVQFLKDNPGYQANLFNDYLYGGYLILNDIPVFIDARSDSYIKFGVQQKYSDIVLLRKDPQPILDEMNVNNIFIPIKTPLRWYLAVNPKWQLVYEGPNACLYSLK